MKILFWTSVLTVLYVYIGYPCIVYLLSFFYKKPIKRNYGYPMVSIVIATYNEERYIEDKIKSLLSLNYPESRFEVLIGSDGSMDRTEEIVRECALVHSPQSTVHSPQSTVHGLNGGKIKFFKHGLRRGKPSTLNLLAKEAKGEILVFTDARQRLDSNALDELVKNFSDRKIGSVSAELIYDGQDSKAGNGVGLYWKYEKFIRKYESRIGSMLGATGALYAIKRELFPELPKDLILDDVYIPLKIIQKGYRAIFDRKAKIYDRAANNAKEEFLRKTRTLAGNFQLFLYLGEFFNPLKSKISWQFFSHKFLRLAVPFLLVVIFISNAFILHNYFYKLVFILQIIFYTFTIFGMIFRKKNRLFDVPYMFCVMNSAAVVGLYRFLMKKQDVLWEKAELAHRS